MLEKLYYSFMYRWCKVQEYYCSHRDDPLGVASWHSQADKWQFRYTMAGRSLR